MTENAPQFWVTFSNVLTVAGLASGFGYTVHQKLMQMAPLSVDFGNGHEITHSARVHDISNAARSQ